jgi:hypothetical protein
MMIIVLLRVGDTCRAKQAVTVVTEECILFTKQVFVEEFQKCRKAGNGSGKN